MMPQASDIARVTVLVLGMNPTSMRFSEPTGAHAAATTQRSSVGPLEVRSEVPGDEPYAVPHWHPLWCRQVAVQLSAAEV